MSYTKTNWQNTPSTQTPISAANLNHMEQGIFDAAQTADSAQSGVDGLDPRMDLVEQRLDNLIPQGTPTQGNAELIDIRVGANGVTYPDAGSAVRGQVTAINSALSDNGMTYVTGEVYTNYPYEFKQGQSYVFILAEGRCRAFTRVTENGSNIDDIIGTVTNAPSIVTFTATTDAHYLRINSEVSKTVTYIFPTEAFNNYVLGKIDALNTNLNTLDDEVISAQTLTQSSGIYSDLPCNIVKDHVYILDFVAGKARAWTRATAGGANIDTVIDPVAEAPLYVKFTASADANYLRIAADANTTMVLYDTASIDGQIANIKYNEWIAKSSVKMSSDIYCPYPQLPADGTTSADFNSDNCTAQDIYDYLDALVTKYPQLLSKTVMGKDASNTYNINRYVFADSTRNDYLATIFIGANEHGPTSDPRECAIVVCRFIKDLCEGHAKTNKLLSVFKKYYKFVFIPVQNPWGFNKSTGGRNNANNVNINRNYDTPGWSAQSDEDKGSSAGSEVETQYIMQTLEDLNVNIALDLHCLGYVNSNNDKKCHYSGVIKNQTMLDEIVAQMKRDYDLTCTSYGNGDYTQHADGDSYFNYKGIDGLLLEFNAREGVTADNKIHTSFILEADYTFMLRILNMLCTVYNSDYNINNFIDNN